MLGTSHAWRMSHSSQRPREPVYYIEDCRIFSVAVQFRRGTKCAELRGGIILTASFFETAPMPDQMRNPNIHIVPNCHTLAGFALYQTY